MNSSLVKILLEAKKRDKWVAIDHVVPYGIYEFDLMQMECFK